VAAVVETVGHPITLLMVAFLVKPRLTLTLVVTNLATQTVAVAAVAVGIMEEELVLMEELV
jgi:hypothetical protein